jgi:hypothetical protein
MNTLRINFILCFCLGFLSSSVTAQSDFVSSLRFQLKLMPDNTTWAVYVKPDNSIAPSTRTTAGSGQVTIVAPVGFEYDNLINHGGTWVDNARVDNPAEAPGKSYISFGFLNDIPRITLRSNQETLLFTFTASETFKGKAYLIDNENDPFASPNSFETNPGNDLGIIDFGNPGQLIHYTYAGNYATENENARPILVNSATGMIDNGSENMELATINQVGIH